MRKGFLLRLNAYRQLRAAEVAIVADSAQAERQLDIACDATSAALRRLLDLPAIDIPEALAKLDAAIEIHDAPRDVIAAMSELRESIGAFFGQAVEALEPFAPSDAAEAGAPQREVEEARPGGVWARFRLSRWAFLEPWYDWGACGAIGVADDAEFDLHSFELDWLWLALRVQFGRRPALEVSHD